MILVAGGSGTRLGYAGPKRGPSLSVSFLPRACFNSRRKDRPALAAFCHGRTIPLFIMTSPENHEATIAFYESHGRFGLDHVRFFAQGQMPAVDRATGKILLASKDRVALLSRRATAARAGRRHGARGAKRDFHELPG